MNPETELTGSSDDRAIVEICKQRRLDEALLTQIEHKARQCVDLALRGVNFDVFGDGAPRAIKIARKQLLGHLFIDVSVRLIRAAEMTPADRDLADSIVVTREP